MTRLGDVWIGVSEPLGKGSVLMARKLGGNMRRWTSVATVVGLGLAVLLAPPITGVANAGTVPVSPTISVVLPDSFTISTLGGCEAHTVTLLSTSGNQLPLRTSGIVTLTDTTGYRMDTAFLPGVDFSGIMQTQTSIELCLPVPVEIVEPFIITVSVFSTACANIANVCIVDQGVSVVRRAPTAPQPPLGITATLQSDSVRVAWTAPASSGGASVTGYTVTSSPDGVTCSTTMTACLVTGLPKGAAYTFTVTATNAVGTSSPSSPSAAVTVVTAPSPPRSVAGDAGDQQVSVRWQAPVDGGGLPITGYSARLAPSGFACTTTELTCVISGLSNGTTYTVTVTALNAFGTSAASKGIRVTLQALVVAPAPVQSLRALPVRGAMRVTWTAPADFGGAPLVTYQFRVDTKAWKPTSKTQITIQGKQGKRITVQVRAVNSAGHGAAEKVFGIPS